MSYRYMENMISLLSKLSNKQMAEADWECIISEILNKNIELNFKYEDFKNKACLNDLVLIEFDGENTYFMNGLNESLICTGFKQLLTLNSFFSPIKTKSFYNIKDESLELECSFGHNCTFSESLSDMLISLKQLEVSTIPVHCEKTSWGVYSVSLIKDVFAAPKSMSLCKASILCLAISIMGSVHADDKLNFESESGIDKVAKRMNETIKDNYRINPSLNQEMNQDPNFDKSRVVNYQRAGNQAINDYIKNDTGVYPALKSLENKIEDFFNGDNALENREQFKKDGNLPKAVVSDLSKEDALQVETQLRTQVLKGQARLKITTSIGEVTTEARAFGGDVFRASAKTKALELKQFGIEVQGTVDYRNSEINSAIRTRINPNTSLHLENVRNVASEGKTDNRVRLNYDLDF